MNNGRTTIVIKPTNDSYNRIRAIKYFELNRLIIVVLNSKID